MKIRVSLSLLVLLTVCKFTLATNSVDDADLKYSRGSAWRQLLRGAHIYSKGPALKWYKKEGGYNQAIADFNALNPTGITRTIKKGYIGQVGDQRIHLYSNDGFTAIIELTGKVKSAYPLRRELRVIEYSN